MILKPLPAPFLWFLWWWVYRPPCQHTPGSSVPEQDDLGITAQLRFWPWDWLLRFLGKPGGLQSWNFGHGRDSRIYLVPPALRGQLPSQCFARTSDKNSNRSWEKCSPWCGSMCTIVLYRGGGNGGRKVPPLPHLGQEDGFSRVLAMPFALFFFFLNTFLRHVLQEKFMTLIGF